MCINLLVVVLPNLTILWLGKSSTSSWKFWHVHPLDVIIVVVISIAQTQISLGDPTSQNGNYGFWNAQLTAFDCVQIGRKSLTLASEIIQTLIYASDQGSNFKFYAQKRHIWFRVMARGPRRDFGCHNEGLITRGMHKIYGSMITGNSSHFMLLLTQCWWPYLIHGL